MRIEFDTSKNVDVWFLIPSIMFETYTCYTDGTKCYGVILGFLNYEVGIGVILEETKEREE